MLLVNNVTIADTDLADFLSNDKMPSGLLIEIIENGPQDWQWITPKLKKTIKQARKKFPNLAVAVVSHGAEEFAFLNNKKNINTKKQIRSLVENENIDFHVCSVQASWHQHTEDDFVNFVTVSTTGPAQIDDYEALGYYLYRLTREGI